MISHIGTVHDLHADETLAKSIILVTQQCCFSPRTQKSPLFPKNLYITCYWYWHTL